MKALTKKYALQYFKVYVTISICIFYLHYTISYRFNVSPNVHLEVLIDNLPQQVTGAELYGMCHNAWLNSARRIIQQRILNDKGNSLVYFNIIIKIKILLKIMMYSF